MGLYCDALYNGMTEAALHGEVWLSHDDEVEVLSLVEMWNRLFGIAFGDCNLHRTQQTFALQVCEWEPGLDSDWSSLPMMFNGPSAFENVQNGQSTVVTLCEVAGKAKLACKTRPEIDGNENPVESIAIPRFEVHVPAEYQNRSFE